MPTATKKRAVFRFYAELNDFLPPSMNGMSLAHEFSVSPSVKDSIENLGVPHTEVELILVNGTPVSFSYLVQDGDRISVYPELHSLAIPDGLRLRPRLVRAMFLADVHLGRLAAYLRMLGFDTVYRSDSDDRALARVSSEQCRILLTRDRGLLKRKEVTYGYFVRESAPKRQLIEVVRRFTLADKAKPFSRCLRCNTPLSRATKGSVRHKLEPKTERYFDEFMMCPSCQRVYWSGSHHQRMSRLVERVLAA